MDFFFFVFQEEVRSMKPPSFLSIISFSWRILCGACMKGSGSGDRWSPPNTRGGGRSYLPAKDGQSSMLVGGGGCDLKGSGGLELKGGKASNGMILHLQGVDNCMDTEAGDLITSMEGECPNISPKSCDEQMMEGDGLQHYEEDVCNEEINGGLNDDGNEVIMYESSLSCHGIDNQILGDKGDMGAGFLNGTSAGGPPLARDTICTQGVCMNAPVNLSLQNPNLSMAAIPSAHGEAIPNVWKRPQVVALSSKELLGSCTVDEEQASIGRIMLPFQLYPPSEFW